MEGLECVEQGTADVRFRHMVCGVVDIGHVVLGVEVRGFGQLLHGVV